MSAYKLIKCTLKDKTILLKALEDLGFKPTVHDLPQFLRGYLGDTRDQMANIIVDKEQLNKLYTKASNDLGFRWNEDTESFDMICSEYDERMNISNIIKQAYAKCVIEEALEKQYFSVESNIDELKNRKKIKVQIVGKKYI
jgi:hypothetical protein